MNANGGCLVCVCMRCAARGSFDHEYKYSIRRHIRRTTWKPFIILQMDFALDASKEINLNEGIQFIHTHTRKSKNAEIRCMIRFGVSQSVIWKKKFLCVSCAICYWFDVQCAMCTRYEIFFWHCIEQQTFKCLNMDVGSLMENRDLLTDRFCGARCIHAPTQPYISRCIQTIRYMTGVKKKQIAVQVIAARFHFLVAVIRLE